MHNLQNDDKMSGYGGVLLSKMKKGLPQIEDSPFEGVIEI